MADSLESALPSSATGASSNKVNINTASASELVSLDGVGESTAAKIIAYRQSNGSFASIEDIKKVSGIGDKKFEAIKDRITV
jgi:competence protein ComEA